MGQACVKDKQVSKRSMSTDSTSDNHQSRKYKMRTVQTKTQENDFNPLFVSEVVEFNDDFHRRHEKHKHLGKKATPKVKDDSDMNLSF
jgi:hypothetical protein